jgi:hypothetical protein
MEVNSNTEKENPKKGEFRPLLYNLILFSAYSLIFWGINKTGSNRPDFSSLYVSFFGYHIVANFALFLIFLGYKPMKALVFFLSTLLIAFISVPTCSSIYGGFLQGPREGAKYLQTLSDSILKAKHDDSLKRAVEQDSIRKANSIKMKSE